MSAAILPVYQSIKDTVKVTGLSEYFLRKQLAAGALPSVRSGTKVFVNVPKLLEQLDSEGMSLNG